MNDKDADQAPELAGYHFNNKALMREALSHPSLSEPKSYQRLEFLGDRILGLVIADMLFEKFPKDDEGQLNRRLSALVRGETIAKVVERIRLASHIRLSAGAEQEGTREKPAVLADIGEAVIGAIYLDAGLEAARSWILTNWGDLLDSDASTTKDSKTQLQEWAQKRGKALPDYMMLDRTGPDHQPVFRVAVDITSVGRAEAEGPSKRVAEQKAAYLLLEQLETKGE